MKTALPAMLAALIVGALIVHGMLSYAKWRDKTTPDCYISEKGVRVCGLAEYKRRKRYDN